ncbi:MAG: hypothetical protein AB7G37_03465 [Solirubrobacteraceae bacterium]
MDFTKRIATWITTDGESFQFGGTFTPTAGKIYELNVVTVKASTGEVVPNVSGMGFTITPTVKVVSNSGRRRSATYRCITDTPVQGPLTVATPGTTTSAVCCYLVEVDGTDPTGTGGANAEVRTTKMADEANTATVTPVAFGDDYTAGSGVLCFTDSANTQSGTSTEDGWTNLGYATSTEGKVAAIYQASATDKSPTVTYTGANHCEAIAIEIAGPASGLVSETVQGIFQINLSEIPGGGLDPDAFEWVEFVAVQQADGTWVWAPISSPSIGVVTP